MYHEYIFRPLYNGLIFLFDFLPWIDAGLAVIIFTCIVKLALFPLSKKAIITQARMKEVQPELEALQKKFKDDKQALSIATFDLYKKKQVNPFSSILLILIQLPILFALYSIFVRSGLPSVNTELLYSFIKVPTINMHLFGYFDIAGKNIILAICASVAQFFQIKYAVGKTPEKKDNATFQEDFARSMSVQMKYVFPIMVLVISYTTSGVIALYWMVSSLFTLGQEIYVKRKILNLPNQ
ncbi:MAG: membrane protein insertase YidC [Candidatus Pacebacteria bacterium]|jgi:YidC/Oxa1 family membrane protein insertase|nr:membrane protein insertase YidC [Candidatus Paceibacterota bacterium]